MRLEFRVLWFENQMADMRNAVTGLRQELSRHGLKLELDHQANADALEDLSRHQERYHDYDLVVVDYDLGDGQPTGDEVAKRIRTSFGFTDIIFYSGTPTDVLREKVKEQAIDGVYCSGRAGVRVKLLQHVGFVVERLSRLEAMRGLAVVTGGKGDDHLRSIIRLSYALLDAAGKDAVIASIDKQVKGFAEGSLKRYTKIGDLDGRLESRSVTSMVLYQSALEAVQAVVAVRPECEPQLVTMKGYLKEVIEPRNNLGHNVEVREEAGWVVRSKAGVEIDKKSIAQFRTTLASHLNNLVLLTNNLSP